MSEQLEEYQVMATIVMPVYNAMDYLEESIGSILDQTFTEFELICIDDGSTDGSGAYLDKCAQNDKRISVIHQENSGGGLARNRGLSEAKGKYVIFLDSDDKFERDLLEKALEKAESNKLDITVFNGDTFDNNTGKIKSAPWLIKGEEKDIEGNPLEVVNTSVWNKLFLRALIEEKALSFQNNRIADNIFFTFMSIVYASRIGILNEILIHYRTNNSSSITSKSDQYPEDTIKALACIKSRLEDDGKFEEKKKIYLRFASEYLVNRLRVFKTKEGFSKYYELLHGGGLNELGFSHIGNPYDNNIEVINNILENSIDGFLLDTRFKLFSSGLLRSENYIIPDNLLLEDGARIILYGGGNVGKDYYVQLSQKENTKLIGWVDKNYESIGFPLQSPNVLKQSKFDKIVVAVLSEKVAKCIVESLVKIGISEKDILWENPIVI